MKAQRESRAPGSSRSADHAKTTPGPFLSGLGADRDQIWALAPHLAASLGQQIFSPARESSLPRQHRPIQLGSTHCIYPSFLTTLLLSSGSTVDR